MSAPAKFTFAAHLQELRARLGWCVAALLAGTALGYYSNQQLLDILVKPLGQTLYYTSPGGGFTFLIQICLGFGFILAIPVLIFHIIGFLAPALPKYSVKVLLTTLIASCLLVILGLAFAYFISLPSALYFLNEFSTNQVKALISTDTYLSFVSIYLAGFALLFQLPLVMLLINYLTPLSPKALFGKTTWVILASFIVAAVITPTPDPFNQAIMAGPIIVLYLMSVCLVWLTNGRQTQPAPMQTVEDILLNLSHKKLVHKQKAFHHGRNGYLCQWDPKKGHHETITTFLHEGKHELVKVHR